MSNQTMLKFAPFGIGIHSIEASKVREWSKKMKQTVINASKQVKHTTVEMTEKYTPVVVGAAVTVAMVAGAGAVKTLEVVANTTADVHDALVHKLMVMDAIHNKEVAALFNTPDSEGQVLLVNEFVADDHGNDSIGQ